ncbi:MAG: peptidylprolyl isomerase [bacterium]|nr:peptidylprolyl isomerase [bacterium]
MNAIFHTTKGDITIEFFGQDTPNTVTNFAKLAESGFYNGVKFHRVIKDFMLQGGDPLTKDDSKAGEWGTGGPGYRFNDEIGPNNRNAAGTISMANSGPNTNGSQFFINLKDNNFLDTKHTVFGRVVQGLDVVQAIGETLVGSNDRPVEPVIINNISLNQ